MTPADLASLCISWGWVKGRTVLDIQITFIVFQSDFLLRVFFWAGIVDALLRTQLMVDLTERSDSGSAG